MTVQIALPIEFSDAAARKVKTLVDEEENPNLKLRVYVTGSMRRLMKVILRLIKTK
jgi:iron-sulfur cluster insertion protein